MTIEIGNNWPVMAVIPPKGNYPQKESTANFPLQNPEDSAIPVNRIEHESNTFWEKGTFLDIYV